MLAASDDQKGKWDANVAEQLTDGAPISNLASSSSGFPSNTDSKVSQSVPQTHVLIIADPQLIDEHTYPGRNPLFMKFSQHTADNYIYKNYRALLKNLQPHIVVFLGDLLDAGRSPPSLDYYETQYARFKDLFMKPTKEHQGKRNKNNIEIITNVPGNHDIGYGNGITGDAIERFESHFGPRNIVIDKPKHELIFLNDLLLTSKKETDINDDLKPYLAQDQAFVSKLKSEPKSKTRILFDHVTLWRDTNSQQCGSKRESKNPFPVARGHQYQTVIDKETSDMILESIKPDIIFSGDDHDFCEVVHDYADHLGVSYKTISVNVKSISMAMGIWQPAVHLLTLYDEPVKIAHDWVIKGSKLKERGGTLDFAYSMCSLSKPYLDVAAYIFAAIGTIIWNIICCHKKKKHIVSITETRVYDSSIKSILENHNWIKFVEYSFIQFGLTLSLYYMFTRR